ncbi:MAG: hypothetical protein II566_03665 [Lachnospiraceae bacterium]|nr:hypothetical protein [Lachnospiraceae bacterium]
MNFTMRNALLLYNIVIALIFMANHIKFAGKNWISHSLFGLQILSLLTMIDSYDFLGERDLGYRSAEKFVIHSATLILVFILAMTFLILALIRKRNMDLGLNLIYIIYIISSVYCMKTYISGVLGIIFLIGWVAQKANRRPDRSDSVC